MNLCITVQYWAASCAQVYVSPIIFEWDFGNDNNDDDDNNNNNNNNNIIIHFLFSTNNIFTFHYREKQTDINKAKSYK